MSRPRTKSQRERLIQAFAREPRVSRRQVAIALLKIDGREPTQTAIESKKSQLVKWLKGDGGMSDDTARKIAKAFTSLGHPYTDRAFMKHPAEQRTWQQEMEAKMDRMLEEIRELREAR